MHVFRMSYATIMDILDSFALYVVFFTKVARFMLVIDITAIELILNRQQKLDC